VRLGNENIVAAESTICPDADDPRKPVPPHRLAGRGAVDVQHPRQGGSGREERRHLRLSPFFTTVLAPPMLRRLPFVFSLCLLPWLFCSTAVAVDRPNHVKASFVAADTSVQPGQSITVALRFVHDPHWHTYWSNPGTGLPTTIKWQLPPGWKSGPIQWPAPRVLFDSKKNVVGNGYEGDLLLPVTLTAARSLPVRVHQRQQ